MSEARGIEGLVSQNWPAWATEPVEVVEWDPSWLDRADNLRLDLQQLEPWLDGQVQHVGSTAVPGLPAKPIVDLMAPVESLPTLEAADATLASAQWRLVPPQLDQRPWRRFYVLPDGSRRVAHLHLVERDHGRWQQVLDFRDALRTRPQLKNAYAELKRRLAQQHRDDREAYTAGKADFIQRALRNIE